MIGLNRDEVLLLDVAVARTLAERAPSIDAIEALQNLKADGRLGLCLDEPGWVLVTVDDAPLLWVARDLLNLALHTDNPMGSLWSGEL